MSHLVRQLVHDMEEKHISEIRLSEQKHLAELDEEYPVNGEKMCDVCSSVDPAVRNLAEVTPGEVLQCWSSFHDEPSMNGVCC